MSFSRRNSGTWLACAGLLASLLSAGCTCGTPPESRPKAADTPTQTKPEPTTKKKAPTAELPTLLPGPRSLPRPRALFTGTSEFSKMRVTQHKTVRTLEFIKDGGKRIRQSVLDVTAPHKLQLGYSEAMFGSLLMRPQHERVLFVGLGGGSMIHFLNHYFPETKIDVVEIDPVVVQVAREWFGIDNDERNTIVTADGVAHIDASAPHSWDVVYMDVFLKPTAEGTNSSGIPESTLHKQFLERLRKRLRPGGLLVFHMHHKSDTKTDIDTIEAVFPSVRRVRRGGDIVVFASGGNLPTAEQMEKRAAEFDERDLGFSLKTIARTMIGTGLVPAGGGNTVKHPQAGKSGDPAAMEPTPPGAELR